MLTDLKKFLAKLKKWAEIKQMLFEQTDDNEETPATTTETV